MIHANANARAMIAAGVLGAGGAFICPSHRNRGEFDALANRLLQVSAVSTNGTDLRL